MAAGLVLLVVATVAVLVAHGAHANSKTTYLGLRGDPHAGSVLSELVEAADDEDVEGGDCHTSVWQRSPLLAV